MAGIHSYEVGASGSDFDQIWVNEIAVAMGRIANVSINPMKAPDYILWRLVDTYYAQNGRTGVVTTDATCSALANGLLDDDTWIHFVGGSTYVLPAAINFSNYTNAIITGNNRRGTIFQPTDTINAFEWDENWWCRLEGFKIDGSLQTTSGMGLMFTEATATNYAKHNQVKNIDFFTCYQGIGDLDATTNAGLDNLFEDLNFYDTTYEPINISAATTGFWRFNRVTIDNVGAQATGTYLMTLSNMHGVQLNNVSILTGGASSNASFLMEDTSFIWMNDVDVEKAGQDIFTFQNCNLANINNIRAAEGGMDAGGGDENFSMQGCIDFNINNFFFGTSTGASDVLKITSDGGVQSARCKFTNGNVSGSTRYGAYIPATSTYINFNSVDFFSNGLQDINESGTSNFNTYKGCSFQSGNGLSFLGENNVYDIFQKATTVIDLSGGATDEDIFYANTACALVGFWLYYTEASSADVDWPAEAIRIGRTQDGVANDPDYFDEVISEASKNLGYSNHHDTAGLAQQYIAAGDTVTVGTAGGKTGTGEIRVILQIIENAS